MDVVDIANRDFLTLEETIELAKKEKTKSKKLLSDLTKLKELIDDEKTDTEDFFKIIDQCPYLPCTEALRIMVLPDNEILNSANYIYCVFTGCLKGNTLKDQVYLKILEASINEDNFLWSYNAARDISEEAKKSPIYASFMSALSKN